MITENVIGQYERGYVDYPNIISSGGLGPCIAIGFYDRKIKRAYMMHESNAHANQTLPDFINEVLKSSSKDDLDIYLTGGGIDTEDYEELKEGVIESKEYVTGIMKAHFKQISFEWFRRNESGVLTMETKPYKVELSLDNSEDQSSYIRIITK